MQQKSTVIEFPPNTPVKVVLKTNPAEAKGKDYTSKAGKPYQKWTYFTADGGVFWAYQDLHKSLQKFSAGDTVTLTNILPLGAQYGTIKVDGTGSVTPHMPVTSDMNMKLAELSNLVRVLIQRFDAHMAMHGSPTAVPSNAPKETREKADTNLDF